MNKMNKFESYSGFLAWVMALLLVALAAGCGGGGEGRDPILGVGAGAGVAGVGGGGCLPGVTAKAITAYTFPTSTATVIDQVPTPKTIAVTVPFGTSLIGLVATFTTTGTGVPPVTVGGLAQVSGVTPNTFPNAPASLAYTVTAGDCSTVIYNVTVTIAPAPPPGPSCAGPGPVDMGAAASFGVLVGPAGGAALSCTLPVTLNGDAGAQGYSCIIPPQPGFTIYTGVDVPYVNALAAVFAPVTGAVACASARACSPGLAFNFPAAHDFGGDTLLPGVYCVTGAMQVDSNLTIDTPGVYIFRSTGALTSVAGVVMAFGGTANATNTSVFWVPTGAASLGANVTFIGTIMPDASAASGIGANTTLLPGRLFSNSDVLLGGTNTITRPTP